MHRPERENEQGFMLVGLIVAIFIILLLLGVAAPKVARGLRRDREVEAIHRGNQYVRAIQLYYKKFGHYPGSMDQLEKTNNLRFLRQRYADPMTGKPDWRLIKVGEAKTTVKGFFGQPLAGLAPGLGTAASMTSPGIGTGLPGSAGTAGTAGTSGTGAGGDTASGGALSGAAPGGSTDSTASGAAGATGTSGTTGVAGSLGGSLGGGIGGSQSGSGFSGGGLFLGVGSSKSGESITVLNEQTTYQTWEFIYDPRIEQLKAKASLFGGGPATSGGSNLGSLQGNASPGIGGATNPTSTTPTTTTPTTPSSPSTTPQ
ncbi:MAG TPA: type II secretion system protein [Edaphobacter sp.]|nr:type II secretion system protein [Edaphobacter sp.]